GIEALDIIRKHPERLTEIPGIGTQRARAIADALAAQEHIEEVKVFLHGVDLSDGMIDKIIKKYGRDAVEVVRANPYRLAHEVWGIGFRKADQIAEKLGIARDAPERLDAGTLHTPQDK